MENEFIEFLEYLRQKYNETKDKRYWKELIRWLPNGWLQTRTWTANYEILRNYEKRTFYHKNSRRRFSAGENVAIFIFFSL